MKKWILILTTLLVSLTYGCKSNEKTDTNNKADIKETLSDSITSINALYFNYSFANKAMYSWNDVKKEIPNFDKGEKYGVLDASIDNPKVIDEIHSLMKTLQPADTNFIPDDRIAITIRYKSGKEDRLAISHTYTDRFYLNNTLQKTNNRLLYLIKNNIGYYAWMIGSDLSNMKELRDTSFIKEPFIRDKYYKLWQEKNQ